MAILIVEDGSGLTDANGYLSVAEADAILALNPTQYAVWTALSAEEQADYIIWASRYLDNYFDWYGYKTVENSGLRWPRCGVTNRDGITIDENSIPDNLKQATAETATWLVNSDAAGSGGESSNLPDGIKRVKADVVELEFFEDGAADSRAGNDLLPTNIKFLLRDLGTAAVGRKRFVSAVR